MATNKRSTTSILRSMSIIGSIIVAGFLVVSLLQRSAPVGKKTDRGECGAECEMPAEYYYRCLRLLAAPIDPYRDRFLDSPLNKYEVSPCQMSLWLVWFYYGKDGTLPAGYVEAVQTRYKRNQTLVDIHICGLDFNRCSPQAKALRAAHYDQLLVRYNNNQTLVDIISCGHDHTRCSRDIRALRRRYYRQDPSPWKQDFSWGA